MSVDKYSPLPINGEDYDNKMGKKSRPKYVMRNGNNYDKKLPSPEKLFGRKTKISFHDNAI